MLCRDIGVGDVELLFEDDDCDCGPFVEPILMSNLPFMYPFMWLMCWELLRSLPVEPMPAAAARREFIK